jgi:hypothetical protein
LEQKEGSSLVIVEEEARRVENMSLRSLARTGRETDSALIIEEISGIARQKDCAKEEDWDVEVGGSSDCGGKFISSLFTRL